MLPIQGTLQFSEHAVLYDMLIPQDHLLRKINDLIDFQFVLDELKSKYCQEMAVRQRIRYVCSSISY